MKWIFKWGDGGGAFAFAFCCLPWQQRDIRVKICCVQLRVVAVLLLVVGRVLLLMPLLLSIFG